MEGTKTITGTLFLSDLFYHVRPPGPTWFGPLDDILLTNRAGSTVSSPSSHSLQRGDIIEIVGAPCTAKTHTLYFLALTTLVPSSWEARIRPIPHSPDLAATGEKGETVQIPLGGRGKGVVALDCDGKFRVKRLAELLRFYFEGRLRDYLKGANLDGLELSDERNMDAMVQVALEHLHVFRPASLPQLTATVRSLPSYLRAAARGKEIAFLIVDGLSALHILPSTTATMNSDLVSALREVRSRTGWITLVTSWASHRSPAVPTLPSRLGSSTSTPQHMVQPMSEAHWALTAQIVTSPITRRAKVEVEGDGEQLEACFRASVNPGRERFEIVISDRDVGAFECGS
ncbi:hypothetical protein BT69DRAFT_1330126 [Atractiella rhizophila]|nr:hypothetical protein BT69DRAFT_1330126 [Atractiella rhizophila]